MPIQIDFENVSDCQAPSEAQCHLWLSTALEGRKANATVAIRIVNNLESQQLNNDYRGKDKPTNVLSFPFDAPVGVPEKAFDYMLGDLVVCAPVVIAEAKQQGKAVNDHWCHMLVHGTLHLIGYDHIKDDEANTMEQLERDILAKLNISDPYLETNED
ncbi:rRNA maturation RNase YbeY [Reinekea forsetii]|nr:rRNA maturation RNase YbeY [Reinekea forsetii]